MSEKKKSTKRIKSNISRCPYLKVTRKTVNPETKEEITVEEFNDCYKTFCVAWSKELEICTYLVLDLQSEEGEE